MAPRLVPAVIPRIQHYAAELDAQIAFLEEQAQPEGDVSDPALGEVYAQAKNALKAARSQRTSLMKLETAWNGYFENNPPPSEEEYWTAEGQDLALRELRQMAVWGVPSDVTPREIRALCPDPSAVVYVTAPTPINAHFFVYVTMKTPAAVDAAMAVVNGKLLGTKHVAASKPLPKTTPTPPPATGSKRSVEARSPSRPPPSAGYVNDIENNSPERGPSTKRARTQEPEAEVSGSAEQAEYEDISDEVTQRLEKQRLARERSLTPGGTAGKRGFGEREVEGFGGLAGVEEEGEEEGEDGEGKDPPRSPARKRVRGA
ncbi:hypothetical protein BU16DRAFT_611905 [Lophium mytilinum]|uniref:RRM domain-containing protein n=1 Tax=Lophium mytilinum TaxID=390894 RepID=A0A6A6RBQ5_9PEZI|nr:hypothetical protein BU16DRAFT_611905 [Lophium mytilinum]